VIFVRGFLLANGTNENDKGAPLGAPFDFASAFARAARICEIGFRKPRTASLLGKRLRRGN
jgi:hypothetical protein